VTKLLREQLDHATTVNESLSAEVAKLKAARDESEAREADFKREEQVEFVRASKQNMSDVYEKATF